MTTAGALPCAAARATPADDPAQLLAHYAWAIDDRRWDDLRDVFAADVRADYEAFSCGSVDELVDRMRELHQPLDASQHLIGSVLVRPEGEDLRVRSHVLATLVKRGTSGGSTVTISAHYDDTVRATSAGLRIAARSVRGVTVHGNRALLPWLRRPDAQSGALGTSHANGV